MKKYIIALSVFFLALNIQAQEVIWKLTYDVGIPFSATKEFTDQVSWRGLTLDFDRFVGDKLALGVAFSWSTFVEKEPDSYYELDNILFHGTQVRYINNIPLTARLSYYQPVNTLDVFGSLGLGTAWQETRREIGTLAFTGDYWQFALIPELGVVIPAGPSSVTAKVRYVQAFETQDAPALSYLSFGLGLAW
jgi:hypothetical protein